MSAGRPLTSHEDLEDDHVLHVLPRRFVRVVWRDLRQHLGVCVHLGRQVDTGRPRRVGPLAGAGAGAASPADGVATG